MQAETSNAMTMQAASRAKRSDKQHSGWRNAVAGTLAGVCTKSTTQPLGMKQKKISIKICLLA